MTKQIIKKSFIKSVGFVILCITQIAIHASLLLPNPTLEGYIFTQLLTWAIVFSVFVPSMIIREIKGSFDTKDVADMKEIIKELKELIKQLENK